VQVVYVVPVSPNPPNDIARLQDLWMAEIDRFEPDTGAFDTAVCAKFEDELDLIRVQADADPNFWETYCDWDQFVLDTQIWPPLEKCCGDGGLRP
jgi:hypothetical protein